MKIWNQSKIFSPEFLAKHHDLVLYNVFHHIKAFLLFPPNCSCEDLCRCSEWREKAILALNTHFYTKACELSEKSNRLYAMKALWQLPEDHLFRGLHADAYPVWAIEKELKEREESDHFKIIDQLVWIFLRLGKTTHSYLGNAEVSVNEVFKILKEPALHTQKDQLKEDERRCGKKKYEDQFKHYQSVCHFIAAQALWKKELQDGEWVCSGLYPPLEHIERFLSLAHWFRKKLLSLKRPNVKENIFLLEENLCPLPPWIQSEGVDFSVEPFGEKIQKALAEAIIINPKAKLTR